MLDFNKINEYKKEDKNNFHLLVSGDNTLKYDGRLMLVKNNNVYPVKSSEFVYASIDFILRNKIGKYKIIIHTSDNGGVDSIARRYAGDRGYSLKVKETDWENDGNRAGWLKNESLVRETCSSINKASIIFWDGENRFTEDLLYNLSFYKIPIRIYNYKQRTWVSGKDIDDLFYNLFINKNKRNK